MQVKARLQQKNNHEETVKNTVQNGNFQKRTKKFKNSFLDDQNYDECCKWCDHDMSNYVSDEWCEWCGVSDDCECYEWCEWCEWCEWYKW